MFYTSICISSNRIPPGLTFLQFEILYYSDCYLLDYSLSRHPLFLANAFFEISLLEVFFFTIISIFSEDLYNRDLFSLQVFFLFLFSDFSFLRNFFLNISSLASSLETFAFSVTLYIINFNGKNYWSSETLIAFVYYVHKTLGNFIS